MYVHVYVSVLLFASKPFSPGDGRNQAEVRGRLGRCGGGEVGGLSDAVASRVR